MGVGVIAKSNFDYAVLQPAGLIPIQSIILTANSPGPIAFDTIPQSFRNLQAIFNIKTDNVEGLPLQLILDTPDGTSMFLLLNFAGAPDSGFTIGTIQLGNTGYDDSTPDAVSHSLIIPDYTNNLFYKNILFQFGGNPQQSSTGAGVGTWSSTNPITKMSVALPAGNFIVGCSFRLYGQ